MFVVKTNSRVVAPGGYHVPLYVAGGDIFFARNDLDHTGLHIKQPTSFLCRKFDNYDNWFLSLDDVRRIVKGEFERVEDYYAPFWRDTLNKDFAKVVAEVEEAQSFCRDELGLTLPDQWMQFNEDALLTTMDTRPTWFLKTCHRALILLADTNECKAFARKFFDKMWEIIKSRHHDDPEPIDLPDDAQTLGLIQFPNGVDVKFSRASDTYFVDADDLSRALLIGEPRKVFKADDVPDLLQCYAFNTAETKALADNATNFADVWQRNYPPTFDKQLTLKQLLEHLADVTGG